MNKELRDQSAHFGSNVLFTILGNIPILGGALQSFVWAVTREYYQHKDPTLGFFDNIGRVDLTGLDLKWSYGGIGFGSLIAAGLWVWIILEIKG